MRAASPPASADDQGGRARGCTGASAGQRPGALVDPVRPEALGLTMTGVWVTLVVLVSGLPIALISLGVGP